MMFVVGILAMIAVVAIGGILGLGDFITTVSGLVVCILIVCWDSAKHNKEVKALQQKNEKALRYDEKSKALYVTHRHPTHVKRFSQKDFMINKYSYTDEKIIFTSATVGGITTGGFDKVGGHSSKSVKSGRYYLMFDYVASNGLGYSGEVRKIVLDAELAKLAKKSPVKEYLRDNAIMVVLPEKGTDDIYKGYAALRMTRGAKESDFAYLGNDIEHAKAEAMPTAKKCADIIAWLSGKDGTLTDEEVEAYSREEQKEAEERRLEQLQYEAEHAEELAAERRKVVKRHRTMTVVFILLALAVAAGYLGFRTYEKNEAYQAALRTIEDGEYLKAAERFDRLGTFKDSVQLAEAAREEAYGEMQTLLEKGEADEALAIGRELGEYRDCVAIVAQVESQIEEEVKRVNAIYRAEDITNDVLEAAKFALQENKYVKLDDLIVEKIQFIDQFRNREWEYLSGDARVPYMSDPDLKKFPNCDRLTTDVSEKANWNTEAVDIRFQDGAILVGVTTSSSYRYDADNNTYVLTENGYKGADYTVTLTDRGTLVIQAERNDGTVYECEYQPAD